MVRGYGIFVCVGLLCASCSGARLVATSPRPTPTADGAPSASPTPTSLTPSPAPATGPANEPSPEPALFPTAPPVTVFTPLPGQNRAWDLTDAAVVSSWQQGDGCLGSLTWSSSDQVVPGALQLSGRNGRNCENPELDLWSPVGSTNPNALVASVVPDGSPEGALSLRSTDLHVFPTTRPLGGLFLGHLLDLKSNPLMDIRLFSQPDSGTTESDVLLWIFPEDVNGFRVSYPISLRVKPTAQTLRVDFSKLGVSNCRKSGTSEVGACDLRKTRMLYFEVVPLSPALPATLDFSTRAADYELASLMVRGPSPDFSANPVVRLKVRTLSGSDPVLRLDLVDGDSWVSTNAMPLQQTVSGTDVKTLLFDFSEHFWSRDWATWPASPDVAVNSTNIRSLFFLVNPGNRTPASVEILEAAKGRLVSGQFVQDSRFDLCFLKSDWTDGQSRVSCNPERTWNGRVAVTSFRQQLGGIAESPYAGASLTSPEVELHGSEVKVECTMSVSSLQAGTVASCRIPGLEAAVSLLANPATGKCYARAEWRFMPVCGPLLANLEVPCAELQKPHVYTIGYNRSAVSWGADLNDDGAIDGTTETISKVEVLQSLDNAVCTPALAPEAFQKAKVNLTLKRSDGIADVCPGESFCPWGRVLPDLSGDVRLLVPLVKVLNPSP